MEHHDTACRFSDLFGNIYLHFYRRRDPRDWRPRPEALALMEHLSATGPLTVKEAALHFDRSQAATSEALERLIRRELLVRLPDEADRRRHLVWLSPKGRALVAEERQVLSLDLLERALHHLPPGETQALLDGLERLLEASRSHRDTHNHGEAPKNT